MKNFKNRCISLTIVSIICFGSITGFLPGLNSLNHRSPKKSAGEITIITPENTTYTQAMTGYFPATFGFENDADGSSPEGWDNPTGTGSYLRVVSEKFGRKKVIEAYDAGPGTGWWASYDFDNTEGAIEFWWAISSVAPSQSQSVFIFDSIGNPLFGVQVLAGQIQVLTGGIWFDISGLTTTANTWDHVRLDFRSDSGNTYQGMNQNQYRIYYNSIDKGTYNFQNIGDPNNTRLYSGLTPSNVYGYLDAFSFSWDPNYNVGDNLNEGLLLSFENSTQLDWTGYSLDNQANKTIIGNTTFSMPSNGTHKIQVFGSDPFGTMYQSGIRYFTMFYELINLITPNNITYTEPMSGYYPASYDFDNEIIGTRNQDISFIDLDTSNPGSYFEIGQNFNNHTNILKCIDGAGASGFYGYHNFNQTSSSGTIEFWYAIDNVAIDNGMMVRFYGDGGHAFYLNCYQGYFRIAGWISIGTAVANNWYHIKMEYDCSINKVNYYIDGVFKWTADFADACNQIETVVIDSDYRYDTSITGYIDAFGYSWDSGYNIGDNKEEGLLLNFTNSTKFDWMAYSIDGHKKHSILGNTTIPLPDNGLHSIQVFGKDLSGDLHRSEIRHFSIYLGAYLPDAPTNLIIQDGIEHIYLSWDVPFDNGAPITHYNIYRGVVEGGSKSLNGTSSTNYYNDSSLVFNLVYYYVITAVTIMGESNDSLEVSGQAWDAPFVKWRSPNEGERVLLSPGQDPLFNFEYDWGDVDRVDLVIINATDDEFNFGDVWNETSTPLTSYSIYIDGMITAELRGYNQSISVANDSRSFNFAKLTQDNLEIIDSNTTYVGDVLYLILHDPSGDNSYTSFAETSTLSMGVGAEITSSISSSIEIGQEFSLFGLDLGYSVKLSAATTEQTGYDFRYEVTDETALTSSLDTSDRNYIGPGYGDRYWGEVWTFKWVLKAYNRTFLNGSSEWEDPKLSYGIIRGGEAVLNDYNAPEEWRNVNPVNNGWQNVGWFDTEPQTFVGGFSYSLGHTVTTTTARTHSIDIGLSIEAGLKIGIAETDLSINLNVRNYQERGETHSYETVYYIHDDESNDTIVQYVGIDELFGTYIFNASTFFSETSNPLEFNTSDYIAPLIDFPSIEYDSNGDGSSPCSNDLPEVVVDIYEEDEVASAHIWYSINGGLNWDTANLTEQVANLGTWQGSIPAQPRGTTVQWYIKAGDKTGYTTIRKNPIDEVYSYTVINSVPLVTVTTPNGGETYQGTVRIEWSASDTDSDILSITLAYNLGGVGWHLIDTIVSGSYYDWDVSGMTYSDSVLIKVIVNDGQGGETEDTSDFVFTIGSPPSTPPGIPGYLPLFLTLSMISIFAICIVVLRRKIKYT